MQIPNELATTRLPTALGVAITGGSRAAWAVVWHMPMCPAQTLIKVKFWSTIFGFYTNYRRTWL